ncbi:hypothetical protein [Agrococcus sediminis]|uniref:hypothetical protein n=1 Tax=Agrococcus sediminis TaxID=2599924 RepID=UPI0034293EDC
MVNDELLGLDAAHLLLRGVLGTVLVLALAAAIGEPWRIALERVLLLRAAERSAAAQAGDGAPPPLQERMLLVRGPREPLHAQAVLASIALAIVAAGTVMVGLEERDPVVRLLLPAVSLGLLAVAVAVAIATRPRGRAAARWSARLTALSRSWGQGARPQPRSVDHARRAPIGALGTAALIGAGTFFAGVVMRQPGGRGADPVRYGEAGELTVVGLVLAGAVALAVAALLLLAAAAVRTARAARARAAALDRLERDAGPTPLLDAIMLDRAPAERVATAAAVLGWGLLALALAPWWMLALEGEEQVEPLLPLAALWPVAALALLAALALAVLGGARAHAQRVLVRAASAHDPHPPVLARRGEPQETAERRVGLTEALEQSART